MEDKTPTPSQAKPDPLEVSDTKEISVIDHSSHEQDPAESDFIIGHEEDEEITFIQPSKILETASSPPKTHTRFVVGHEPAPSLKDVDVSDFLDQTLTLNDPVDPVNHPLSPIETHYQKSTMEILDDPSSPVESAALVPPVIAERAEVDPNPQAALNSLLLNDPWASETKLDAPCEIVQPLVEPQSDHVDTKEIDQDTSPIKGFQNFTDSTQIDDLVVQGQLPKWLIGEHFTVGPATYDIKYLRKVEIDGELQNTNAHYTFGHWFDALPLVNRFDLNGSRNTIVYRNKATSKRMMEKIREHQGYAPQHPNGLYMSNTNQTVLSKILGPSKPSRPDGEPCGARVLTRIPGLPGRLFAQNRANHIQELDPFDLTPTRLMTWNEINPKFKGTSACPNGQYDHDTGEYINFLLEAGYQTAKYNFFSISDQNPQGRLIASLTAPMAHVNTFLITPKYIILVLCPMLANANGMKYSWGENIMNSFSFRKTEPTLFYVLSRQTGQLKATYRSEPIFILNAINGFEDGVDLMLDLICYSDDTIVRQLRTDQVRTGVGRLAESKVRRYRLGSVERQATPPAVSVGSRLSSVLGLRKSDGGVADYGWMSIASFEERARSSIELPQIHPRVRMFRPNFMYGLGFSTASLENRSLWDSIVKINLETKKVVATWYQKYCYPSEAVFVPKPGGKEEDEGVLISVVMDSARSTSFLLVLDSLQLNVLATADLERLVPLSFAHGSFRLQEDY